MGQKGNNTQKAIVDIAKALSGVFKKYQRQTSSRAVKKLCSSNGKKALEQLAQNPNRPLNQFPKLAFREWVDFNEDNPADIENILTKLWYDKQISPEKIVDMPSNELLPLVQDFIPATVSSVPRFIGMLKHVASSTQ